MSHSPYGRNPTSKTDQPSPPPSGKTTTPNEAAAANAADELGQEPSPFEVTPEEAAAVIVMRYAAERWQLDPARVAQLAAKALFLASDVTSLGEEFARVLAKLSPEVKEQYRTQLDSLARAYLDSRADDAAPKKGRGKRKPAHVNPDAGHGAADGFGGSDFPPTMPGPDEGRPQ